jgi:hypothetical protein
MFMFLNFHFYKSIYTNVCMLTLSYKQERNSNQVRALLGQSNMGTDGPTNGPMDEVSYRGAMLAPKIKNNYILIKYKKSQLVGPF